MLPWLAFHRKRPPSPPPDEYGQPVPAIVLEAIDKAKSSLLGLETREGFAHLREDEPQAEPAREADEAAASVAHKPVGDVAYDDGDDDEPYVWDRLRVDVVPSCRRARLHGLDGLCDARSLKNLLATLRPRAVLVSPSPKARDLVSFLLANKFPARVPKPGEAADLSAVLGRAPLLDADLSPGLLHRVNTAQVALADDLSVVRFNDAVLCADRPRPRLLARAELDHEQPADDPGDDDRHLWLAAHDLGLPALKDKLQAAGLKADIRAGALVCAGNILVKKTDAGKKRQNIRIEGPLSPEYFTVASVLKTALTLV